MSAYHLTNPKLRRVIVAWIVSLTLFAIGCSTTTPRVLEVSSRTRLRNIDPADEDLFSYDQASRIRFEPRDLSIDEQREEFYIRWRPGSVGLVKFEYRQIGKPTLIAEQTYAPHGDASTVFKVHGEEFRSGGSVSAWRVSLWDGDQLVAEKKSFLW
jgi:hypothetical protein